MNSTEICNMALAYIGQGSIASLHEDSEEARQCEIFYTHLRKKLLSEYRWNFAERYGKLAWLDVTLPGWTYVYSYPAQCLVVRDVYDREHAEQHIGKREWKIVSVNDSTKAIVTNIQDAHITYTADVENAEIFSHYFIEALAHALASAIAIPLSGSHSLAQLHAQEAMNAIQFAKYRDVIEDNGNPDYPSAYYDARR